MKKWFYWQNVIGRWYGVLSYGDRPNVSGGQLKSTNGHVAYATEPVNVSEEPYCDMSLDSLKVCFPHNKDEDNET